MRITKFTHSCLRVEGAGVLVVDPGELSERSALAGADAVLITHEHFDHVSADALGEARAGNPGLRIFAHADVLAKLGALAEGSTTVEPGQEFEAAGYRVRAFGGRHAVIHPDIPRITNVGYLVDGGRVFHPGDALTVPDHPVETLMLPVMAPWSKISEVIDYVRELKPQRAYDIHDALLTDLARPIYDRQIGQLGGSEHLRLTPGDSAEV